MFGVNEVSWRVTWVWFLGKSDSDRGPWATLRLLEARVSLYGLRPEETLGHIRSARARLLQPDSSRT